MPALSSESSPSSSPAPLRLLCTSSILRPQRRGVEGKGGETKATEATEATFELIVPEAMGYKVVERLNEIESGYKAIPVAIVSWKRGENAIN